ncbi:outer membrane protein assembly factor BamB family protein [Paractinoplanes lichenicola]|uniref:PQQ-binding-like beta-propeller repeat protein n=1 Tax=Paractinoplanes lichenicola TaxID=2802976 RepID=A0ABS1VJ13_9ACTN|nr:PQQ-binding-like beta-propeller repeat protein [Actinoplanes lichenicola]MBL7253737.1 PQQ-binding-like beta-propeller repeat protein [Actinoplanes lichenicola]
MALIELDLTAQPEPTLTPPPPAHRYRLPGLLLVVVLALATGGAAPALPVLWRYLGAVPSPGGPEAPFQLAGGRVYTVAASGTERVTTAWSLESKPRELWQVSFPARVSGPDEISWGTVDAEQAGDVVLFGDGPETTIVDAETGATRWTSPVAVTPLPGSRVGITQRHDFRPDTVYDQASGEPGMLYFSATGEPHTEPPLRTHVSGVDLADGRELWTLTVAGSVNVAVPPGDEAAALLLSSDRLRRIDGTTGAVVRSRELPRVGGIAPASGELVDGLMMVYYGRRGVVSREVAYAPDTLEQRWQRRVPSMMRDPANCTGMHCSGGRQTLDVLDPQTGEARWRAPDDVDLAKYGGYVVEVGIESGMPVRLVDPATGATRVDLTGWRAEVVGESGQPIVLRRSLDAGASAFGVVVARRDEIQPLGVTGGPVSDCSSDARHVVCRTDGGLRIWAYRA